MLLRVLSTLLLTATLASAEITATTQDGKGVVLYENGTWKYVDQIPKEAAAASHRYARSVSATDKIELLRGKAAVYYDATKWRDLKETEPGRFELTHREGDAYAVVIAERAEMPLDALRNLALKNARELSPDIRSVAEEKRVVNDTEVLFMQTAGTMEGMPIAYLGYYYAGKPGAVQVITFTARNLLDEYRKDLEEFLNGFQAQQQ